MKTKQEKIRDVILSRSISKYKIKEKGQHTGLFDENGKWVAWLTKYEVRELKDLGVSQ